MQTIQEKYKMFIKKNTEMYCNVLGKFLVCKTIFYTISIMFYNIFTDII